MKKISTKELAHLLTRSYQLALLEAGGVDNWEWYDASLNGERDDETMSYSDYCELSDEEITAKYEDA